MAVSSGQSAMLLVLMTLMKSGDAYVASPRLFGGSLGLMRRLDGRYDLKPHFAARHEPGGFRGGDHAGLPGDRLRIDREPLRLA